jgi:hypothetical protein
MEELLATLFSLIFEIFGDALLQFTLQAIVDIAARIFVAPGMTDAAGPQNDKGMLEQLPAAKTPARRFFYSILPRPVRATIIYFVMGLSIGWGSLFFFPHPLVHPSRFHGISLLVSPTISGLMMWWLGASLRKRDKKTTQIESFGYGFVFALGVALMRFLYTD